MASIELSEDELAFIIAAGSLLNNWLAGMRGDAFKAELSTATKVGASVGGDLVIKLLDRLSKEIDKMPGHWHINVQEVPNEKYDAEVARRKAAGLSPHSSFERTVGKKPYAAPQRVFAMPPIPKIES